MNARAFPLKSNRFPTRMGYRRVSTGSPNSTISAMLIGIDRVQFLIAPNPGEPFKAADKIASRPAKTSRLMLALKTILSAADATPTLIFDEIDAGISGRSGQIVGEKLWQLNAGATTR